jgi:methionyl-tRNA formyltransferase
MEKTKKLIIIGYSKLALRLYEKFSKSLIIEIIYSERELKEFNKEIKLLKKHNIFLVKDIDRYLQKLNNKKSTIIFSLGSSFIFKNKILNLYKNRIFNCHNTDLPRWKGGGDISYRIMNEYNNGATTIHEISDKIDEGRIVFQKKYKIKLNDTTPYKLRKLVEKKAYNHLILFFNKLFSRKKFFYKKNKNSIGFYLPRLNTDIHGAINWDWDGREIKNFINAFSTPYRGAFCFCRKKKVRIFKAKLIKQQFLKHPFMYGIIFRIYKNNIYVAAKDYSLIINKKDIKLEKNLDEGDRLYTPQSTIDLSKSLRVIYSHKGATYKK